MPRDGLATILLKEPPEVRFAVTPDKGIVKGARDARVTIVESAERMTEDAQNAGNMAMQIGMAKAMEAGGKLLGGGASAAPEGAALEGALPDGAWPAGSLSLAAQVRLSPLMPLFRRRLPALLLRPLLQ